ncbi:response regulator [Paenibacillus sp. MER TA 81-3]|uniref:response regulator n=1 Tax=Paenibacillus sp. MER TA 81-3 TaxID=2939573 RepID=UPI00203B5267|nr:response regulator [Paenibacillus sp. MER TA 81-3]MCM3341648.1 response regulator [Paenibacillus sp. MER TA 81-3]
MNLLIAEDETRLLENLSHMPWDKHAIEMVGTACNGTEALIQIKQKQPDILLMDIQMPEMDGLTLAREVTREHPHIKIIILSGHDNFKYAQAAIELGVYKYLLKPAGESLILQSVRDAAQCIHAEFIERSNRVMLQEQWTHYLPILHQHFYKNVVHGHYRLEEIEHYMKSLKLDIDLHSSYALIIIDVDEHASRIAEGRLDSNKLIQLIRELLSDSDYYLCKDENGSTIVIGRIPGKEEVRQELFAIHTTLEKLLRNIKQCLDISVSAGISGDAGRLHELHPLYVQAKKALQNRAVYGGGIAIPYHEPDQIDGMVHTHHAHDDKQLEMALETADEELAMLMITNMWEASKNNSASYESIMEQMLYITGVLALFIRKRGWSIQEVTGTDFAYLYNLQSLTIPDRMYDVLRSAVKSIVSYSHCHDRKVTHKTVEAILELLETEVEQEFTLHTLADRFYVNASYLSRLFKQETGMSFTSYVLERKMERAKAALMNGARVYDAASMIGYRDISYFTKMFRRYWGVTPGSIKK